MSTAIADSLELEIGSTRRLVRGVATGVAKALSQILCPPFVLIGMVLLMAKYSIEDFRGYAETYTLLALVLPLALLVTYRVRGRISDLHMNNRSERFLPFLWSIVGAAAGWSALVISEAPALLESLASAHLVSAILLLLFTLRWKVSIHAAAIAGVAVMGVRDLHLSAPLLILLASSVCWSRVYLRRHTIPQTLVGALLGTASFLLC
ncbi:MAG: hypothetical protein IT290_07465 [Deltaproteobacteria bacterium]|nr:hypothetical protein [Deltaproteobacteria bacterium]